MLLPIIDFLLVFWLLEFKKENEIYQAIDAIIDLQHNTGQVFSGKIPNYYSSDIKDLLDFWYNKLN